MQKLRGHLFKEHGAIVTKTQRHVSLEGQAVPQEGKMQPGRRQRMQRPPIFEVKRPAIHLTKPYDMPLQVMRRAVAAGAISQAPVRTYSHTKPYSGRKVIKTEDSNAPIQASAAGKLVAPHTITMTSAPMNNPPPPIPLALLQQPPPQYKPHCPLPPPPPPPPVQDRNEVGHQVALATPAA